MHASEKPRGNRVELRLAHESDCITDVEWAVASLDDTPLQKPDLVITPPVQRRFPDDEDVFAERASSDRRYGLFAAVLFLLAASVLTAFGILCISVIP